MLRNQANTRPINNSNFCLKWCKVLIGAISGGITGAILGRGIAGISEDLGIENTSEKILLICGSIAIAGYTVLIYTESVLETEENRNNNGTRLGTEGQGFFARQEAANTAVDIEAPAQQPHDNLPHREMLLVN